MPATLLDGKALAAQIRARLKQQVASLVRTDVPVPALAVILVGDDPAADVYVRNKKRACEEAGFISIECRLPSATSQTVLLRQIEDFNRDPLVHGILVQMPLPASIDARAVLETIDPAKDVDGFHPVNLGRLLAGEPGFVPCTPAGVMALLAHHRVELRGKRALVVGRSNIVGKPMAHLLLGQHATVTIAHSRTTDLAAEVARAEVLVAAIGKPGMIAADWIRPGAVVADVGINRIEDPGAPGGGRLVGDVAAGAAERAALLTPVPGGVGPMTIAMLLFNTVTAHDRILGLGTPPTLPPSLPAGPASEPSAPS